MTNPLETALNCLPHGPEFRFLDRLVSLHPGRSGTGEYSLRGDELFLRGHFPGDPLLPGVLIVEAAAQLAGVVAQCDPTLEPLQDLKLTAIRNVKLLGAARPGQVIRLEARITGRLGNLVQADVSALVDGQQVMAGSIALSGTPHSASSQGTAGDQVQ